METTITRKRWRWLGHVLRMYANSITKVAKAEAWSTADNLTENRGSGIENHEPQLGHRTIQRLARDRQGWRSFVAALYAGWPDGQ